MELLTPLAPRLTAPAVVHCFTGTADEAAAFLSLGLYVGASTPRSPRASSMRARRSRPPPPRAPGFTGWLTDEREGRAEALAAAVRTVPLERLLVETDAPYLVPRSITPSKLRPKRNEPCLLPHVAAAVAAAKGARARAALRVRQRQRRRQHASSACPVRALLAGLSVEEVAEATTRNARSVFGLRAADS